MLSTLVEAHSQTMHTQRCGQCINKDRRGDHITLGDLGSRQVLRRPCGILLFYVDYVHFVGQSFGMEIEELPNNIGVM